MRITGGTLGGRLVIVPKDIPVRPTTDRVREAVFSTLYSMGVVKEARTLDLYAGSGLLGLESLSRGAPRAVFVENDKTLVQTLETHLELFGLNSRGRIVCAEVDKFIKGDVTQWGGGFDLVFIDPPYAEHPGQQLLERLLSGNWLKSGSVVVVESASKSMDFPETITAGTKLSLGLRKAKRYGDNEIALFVCS